MSVIVPNYCSIRKSRDNMADYFFIFCSILITILSLYYYYVSTYNFWRIRHVPGPRPIFFYGNFKDVVTRKLSISQYVKKIYDKYKHEPAFGIFQTSTPVLIVNDLNLIKDVLIRDFSLFSHRGLDIFKKAEPLSEHLFQLEPERWKPLRTRLSPVFTSGKLKDMFPLIVECGNHLEKYMEKTIVSGDIVECHELAAKFTTDVIGSCAFGISMNDFNNEGSQFREMGREYFVSCTRQAVRDICRLFLPFLYSKIGHMLQPKGVNEFFLKAIVDAIKYRMENNVIRPDFVNMLMELKQNSNKVDNIELTDSLLASQAFVFFVAGFETSSSTMGFALYELAQNQYIQDKLREEIRQYIENGKMFTYDQVKQMTYLDAVFQETLRKHSILPILMRQASDNYTFRGTKIRIPKDTSIWIPIYAIQNDPDIFPNPHVFDPERFNDNGIAARHAMSFLPFGDGPRNCIGSRFAHYQTKVGLITILRNHKVDVCEKTTIPFETQNHAFLLTMKGGVCLKVTKVE